MRPTNSQLKKTLIILTAIALALGVIVVLVVFYPGDVGIGGVGSFVQNITPSGSSNGSNQTMAPSTSASIPTSSQNIAAGTGASFVSTFSAPYPVNWNDAREQFSVIGASFRENQLTLTLSVKTSGIPECVPLDVRLVKNESGDLQAPDAPQFSFPDTGSCTGGANETYSEPVTFTIDSSLAGPYLLTTGGTANLFFTAATSSAGGINVALPSTSG